MANLTEPDNYPAGIYRIEETDPVLGGAPNETTKAGLSNIPHQQLARRTRWLKGRVDQLVAAVVDATTSVKGIVQLSNSVNSSSTTTAATSAAVKSANDNANGRVSASRSVSAGGLATGGGALSANLTISVPAAGRSEAEEGAINDKAMTPLRVAQAIAALVPNASDTVRGLLRISSSSSTNNGAIAASTVLTRELDNKIGERASASLVISTAGLATGGGSLTQARTIDVPVATKAQAEAGTVENRAMTPLRVAEAIAALVPPATVSVAGRVTLASSEEAIAGQSNGVAVSPLRMRQRIEAMAIGWGQSWVRPSRSVGTWYQNTTNAPIMVMITSNSGHRIHIGPSTSNYISHDESGSTVAELQMSFVVPVGHYYRLMESSGANVDWSELR